MSDLEILIQKFHMFIQHSLPNILQYLTTADKIALCYASDTIKTQLLLLIPVLSIYLQETILKYDIHKIPLRNAVTPSLIDDSTGNIDQLHLLLPPEPSNYKRKGTTGQERWQRSIVAERWRQRGCQNSEEVGLKIVLLNPNTTAIEHVLTFHILFIFRYRHLLFLPSSFIVIFFLLSLV